MPRGDQSSKGRQKSKMSDLPELNLFEEIQGIANSSDFYTYTQEEFNKTWSHYETETSGEMKGVNRVGTPTSNMPTPPSSGKSSPTRDTWDPMLWHTRSMEEVELRALTELAVTPPMSPSLPSSSVSNSFVTPVFEASRLDYHSSKLTVTAISAGQLPLPGCFPPVQLELRGETPVKEGSSRAGGETQKSQIVRGRRGVVHPPPCMLFKTKKVQRRKKLYQMKPFTDPVKEKESFKLNQEKQTGLESKKTSQINRLKQVNSRLSKEAIANRRKLVAARQDIKLLRLRLESSVLRLER